MPMSREERMQELTGPVPADVSELAALVNRLAGAVADVQETIGRIEARQVDPGPPSAQVSALQEMVGTIFNAAERVAAARHADLQTAVGSLVHTLDRIELLLSASRDRVEDETAARAVLAMTQLGAFDAKLDAIAGEVRLLAGALAGREVVGVGVPVLAVPISAAPLDEAQISAGTESSPDLLNQDAADPAPAPPTESAPAATLDDLADVLGAVSAAAADEVLTDPGPHMPDMPSDDGSAS